MPKTHESTLELDLNALGHNFRYIKSRLKPETAIMGVVKADAYGSEAIEIARELENLGAEYLAVAYTKEGVALRDHGIQLPIMVLHPLPYHFKTLIDRCLEPSLYSLETLRLFDQQARDLNQKAYPVHLKLNTGLNRLGLAEKEIDTALEILNQTDSLSIKSILSHLAATEDEAEREFTLTQINTFKKLADRIDNALSQSPKRHILNTSGVLNYPEAHFDMVRCGIGLYGFGNDPQFDQNFRPVATLKTVITQIHEVESGQSVGYNRGYVADRTIRSATLPIGHADGIFRAFGQGRGWVKINGKKAPFLGNVCMDMIMVDVTDVDCKAGDEVVVFGDDPSLVDLAKAINTIPYELLTAISSRVVRKLVRN